MINYIPPDIPKPVIQYVKKHRYYKKDFVGYYIKYLTYWKNEEVYVYHYRYKKDSDIHHETSFLFYDCKEFRRPTLAEHWEMKNVLLVNYYSKTPEPHICGKNKDKSVLSVRSNNTF